MTAGRKVHIVWKRGTREHPWTLHRVCSSADGATIVSRQLEQGGWLVKVSYNTVDRVTS